MAEEAVHKPSRLAATGPRSPATAPRSHRSPPPAVCELAAVSPMLTELQRQGETEGPLPAASCCSRRHKHLFTPRSDAQLVPLRC
ncbi:hypothetical protein INR49_021240 [Caranx melampygus]|nr:hypothetical protein INR49_021240 [Caranx melampygus]